MNSFVVILSLSCLAAVTFASPTQDIVVEFMANGRARCRNASCGRNGIVGASCPPTNCPPRQPPTSCGGEPDCNIVANRAWHHVHWDPNFFWQCRPWQGENDWRPIAMPCACGTLFVTASNRCQHPHEWAAECPGQTPELAPCDEDCGPVCDGDGNGPTPAPPTPAPTPEPSPATDDNVPDPVTPSPPGNGDCPCICIPCILWPCNPCTASSAGCPCSQNQQQQRPQPQPLPQPLPQPPRDNPWARPEAPRQPPTQWVPEQPRQPPTQWQPQPPNQRVPEAPRQPPTQWVPEQPRQPEWQPPRIPQQPPTNWQQQPPNNWQPQPPQQWQPQPPQNNPWQRPFAGEEDVEEKEDEVAAEDEAL